MFEQIGLITGGWCNKDNVEPLQAGCQRHTEEWDNLTIPKKVIPNRVFCSVIVDLANHTVPCTRGYIYNHMLFHYDSGVVETFVMICEKSLFIPIVTSIFLLGMILGFFCSGFWNVRFGLRDGLLELSASVASSFLHAFWLYSLLRVFTAIGNHDKLSTFNIILLEVTTPPYRSLVNPI